MTKGASTYGSLAVAIVLVGTLAGCNRVDYNLASPVRIGGHTYDVRAVNQEDYYGNITSYHEITIPGRGLVRCEMYEDCEALAREHAQSERRAESQPRPSPEDAPRMPNH